MDFAVWIENLGRFALQVKGGRYLLSDGEWYLGTRDGVQLISTSSLDEAWLAALDLHDDIGECACTPYNPFFIPVLSFPDMGSDAAIESLAKGKGVYVIWGTDNLLADLERIVQGRNGRGCDGGAAGGGGRRAGRADGAPLPERVEPDDGHHGPHGETAPDRRYAGTPGGPDAALQ